ncbi:MAG: hypothetical protein M3Z22_04680 [Verrucomicrobiota bacterium]|nr:hypothetical protein [Verrucomicrobiota bacterium]
MSAPQKDARAHIALKLVGTGNARAFAEVCAALLLAGELSITGALCANEFTKVDAPLARDRSRPAHQLTGK